MDHLLSKEKVAGPIRFQRYVTFFKTIDLAKMTFGVVASV